MKASKITIKVLKTNNERRFFGKPLYRKGKGKRYKTRNETLESIGAFIDFCNEI